MRDLKVRWMLVLLLTHMSHAWTVVIPTRRHNISFRSTRSSFLLSNVVDLDVGNDGTTSEAIKNVKSKKEEQQQQNEHQVPYVIRRGDGSTGGGGWIMKGDNAADENTTTLLRRPKVGASMPIGRPDWFRVPAPKRQATNPIHHQNGTTITTSTSTRSRFEQVQDSLKNLKLHTVCEEAQCPNIGECWNGGTGTIMLLGDTCTRGCLFCAVNTASTPAPPDPMEPFATAKAILDWGVSYIVLTSVDRDDLDDGGANHFATTVQLLKQNKPELLVECLVSDFAGNLTCVETLARSGLDVYAHNVETVERLQPYVRDRRAGYQQSLRTLQHAKQSAGVYTKTSLMLGLGETKEEIIQTMQDLRAIDVDVVTFGQYLRPTEHHLAVVEYVHPRTFDEYREIGEKMGFRYVASGPMVRSSYKAGEYFLTNMIRQDKPQ